jgi:hypothetical protein
VPGSEPVDGFLAPTREHVTLRQDKYASVIVLSTKFQPTDQQLSVLSKGANFCPTPKFIDEVQLRMDLGEFQRRMRLLEFFSDRPETEYTPNPFKAKSTWKPPRRCKYTESYLQVIESEIFHELSKRTKFYRNFSSADEQALRELTSNTDIIIKGADKGSGIVIMDSDRYVQEALRQLNDVSTYRLLDHDPSPAIESQLKSLVDRVHKNDSITSDMATYAIPSEHKPARFYLLPKVHKPGVPGRPVVSCCGALTENLSEIVDHIVKPYITAVTSYLKDTNDFLSKIRSLDTLPPDSMLVSLDVVNLYPSIPHEDGLSALSAFLLQQGMPSQMCTDLCEMARFVLTHNVLEFDSRIYLQVSGTAIGTRLAPTRIVLYFCTCLRLGSYLGPPTSHLSGSASLMTYGRYGNMVKRNSMNLSKH